MTEDLLVPVEPPKGPHTLVNAAFLTTLAACEKQASELRITDAQSAQAAANLQIRLTDAAKKLESARAGLKAPFLEIGRKIDDAAREPALRIENAKKILQRGQIQFDIDQRRIAAEAEAKRQAEIKRLEEQRISEEREAQRKAAEIAAQQKKTATPPPAVPAGVDLDMDFGDEPAPQKTETEVKLEQLKYSPPPAPTKPVGVAFRTRLRAVVVDVNKLPEHFVTKTPKDAAIYSTFCAKYKEGEPLPECPGVRFEIDRTAVSTGKAVF